MSHIDDKLHDWFLGALSESEAAQVDDHLAECADCQAALDQHLLLMAAADAPAPPPVERLLASATPLKRFERFAETVARVADVTVQVAREWLAKIDDTASWSETAMEQLLLFHIDGGPAVDGAIVGFVQIAPGEPFPHHTHLGDEIIYVLQGGLRDENDVVHGPGDLVERAAGTEHAISAEPGIPLIYLNIVHEGLELFGMRFGPAEF